MRTAPPRAAPRPHFSNCPPTVSWEPDLWGKIRNTVRQAQYSAQLSAADLENERLTEQASLATFFFELRGQDALQQILDATVAADQKALDYARAQYETGISDQIAVVQAESTLESVQSQATNLGIARAQYEHAIATLIGKAASDFSIPVQAAADHASAHSGRAAVATSGTPSGHCRRRTHPGRRQRPDRHCLCRLLSERVAVGLRRL